MTRHKHIGGTLTLAGLKVLSEQRQVDVVEPRPDRPTDRIDFIREARQMLAQGASVTDVSAALDVPETTIRLLIGPKGK